jgi:hypothetical protein|tara:strand:+ start:966 stop:1838 length:873 start_codon:yes stop_codon:yes gene_type:complete
MAQIIRPKVSTYGNSFSDNHSDTLTDHNPLDSNQIDLDNLNKTRQSSVIEFTDFEQQIRDYALASLGHPVVRVELNDHQLKLCVDEAITELDYHAPHLTKQMAVFYTTAGVNVYEIPNYILRNLAYVTFKKSLLSIQAQAGTLEFDFFIKYFSDNFLFDNFSMGDFYILQSSLETTRRVLGQDGGWDILDGRYLQLYPSPAMGDAAILEYRGINSQTMTPKMLNWIQKYATACAKGLLGQVRGKFAVVPGPGGGTQLNGAQLLQEAVAEKVQLKEELLMEIEEPPMFTTG